MWSSHVPRNVQLEANVEVEYRVHGACPVGPHHRGGYYTTNFFPRVVSVSLQFLFTFHYTTPVAKFVPVRGAFCLNVEMKSLRIVSILQVIQMKLPRIFDRKTLRKNLLCLTPLNKNQARTWPWFARPLTVEICWNPALHALLYLSGVQDSRWLLLCKRAGVGRFCGGYSMHIHN